LLLVDRASFKVAAADLLAKSYREITVISGATTFSRVALTGTTFGGVECHSSGALFMKLQFLRNLPMGPYWVLQKSRLERFARDKHSSLLVPMKKMKCFECGPYLTNGPIS
jgi:hypothetical protein